VVDDRPCCKTEGGGGSSAVACVCGGRGCEYQCIYTAHRPIDFLRSTVAGGDVAYHGHGTHKDGPGGKSQTSPAKIYKIFRHELFTFAAIQRFSVRADDAQKIIDTYLSRPIAKSVNGAKALRR
jgi:hypothetical protein